MRLYATIVKAWKECLREWKVLSFVLVFSPFFVLIMKLFYGGEVTVYQIGVVDLDTGAYSKQLIQNFEDYTDKDKNHIFKLHECRNEEELKKQVESKTIDVGIMLPEGYTDALNQSKAKINLYGSTGNSNYILAAIMISDIIYKQGIEVARITLPLSINEIFSEKKVARNSFEVGVPGLISMAVLMILFTASAAIVKENDKGTLIRLKLSRLGSVNYLTGVCIVQALISILAITLSYWTALGIGYRPAGSFWPVLVVGIVSSLSMVAISLVVASFLNTVFDVLTIGCFPFFIMMFFSGCMFPLPKIPLFSIAGHTVGAMDILPLTLTVDAMNKILNFGAGLSEVTFQIFLILLLTVIYFIIGVTLYQKRKLSKA